MLPVRIGGGRHYPKYARLGAKYTRYLVRVADERGRVNED